MNGGKERKWKYQWMEESEERKESKKINKDGWKNRMREKQGEVMRNERARKENG